MKSYCPIVAMGLVRRTDGRAPRDAHPSATSDRHPCTPQHATSASEHARASPEHAPTTRDHGTFRPSSTTTTEQQSK